MEKTDKADARPGDSNRITREYLDSLLVETRLVDSVLPCTELELSLIHI